MAAAVNANRVVPSKPRHQTSIPDRLDIYDNMSMQAEERSTAQWRRPWTHSAMAAAAGADRVVPPKPRHQTITLACWPFPSTYDTT